MCAQGAAKRQTPPHFASTLLWVPSALQVWPSLGFAARTEGSWGKPAARHPSRRKRGPLPLSPSPFLRIATLTLGTVAENNISGHLREGLQFYYLKENVLFALVLACHSLPRRLVGDLEGRGNLAGSQAERSTDIALRM